jgi:hypothetical membrane protein
MQPASLLLKLGVLVPVLYYGVLLVGGYLTPGYNHFTQYASELGMAGKPAAQLFNYGIIAAGACAIIGALGALIAMKSLGSSILWAILAALFTAAFGVSLVYGGLYPMPNPLHAGPLTWKGLGLGIMAIPAALFMFLGLSGRSDMGGVKSLLILSFLAMIGLTLVMFNVGGLDLVDKTNIGLWQRGYSLAMILWIGLVCLGMDQALGRRGKRRRDPMRDVVFGEG